MTPIEKARQLRARTDVHFNCCQSVLIPFADKAGLAEDQAFALGANFNAGMRCGSACGALTGALMVLGMTGCPPEQADEFRKKFGDSHGSINCADLLKAAHERGTPRKEHCDGLVFDAVQALEECVCTRDR